MKQTNKWVVVKPFKSEIFRFKDVNEIPKGTLLEESITGMLYFNKRPVCKINSENVIKVNP